MVLLVLLTSGSVMMTMYLAEQGYLVSSAAWSVGGLVLGFILGKVACRTERKRCRDDHA